MLGSTNIKFTHVGNVANFPVTNPFSDPPSYCCTLVTMTGHNDWINEGNIGEGNENLDRDAVGSNSSIFPNRGQYDEHYAISYITRLLYSRKFINIWNQRYGLAS